MNAGRIAWGVALLALLPHLVGLANGFVYDDFRFLVENRGVQTLARPWEFLSDPARTSWPIDRDIWRPLRTLLFAIEHALFGGRALGWHAVSLLLHLLLVRGVIALAARCAGITPGRALAAGLLFGVHPLTCESVAWISSQGDLLAALFVVVCLAFAGERPRLAVMAALLALLAKESALPLVLALAAARCFMTGATRPRWKVILATATLTVLVLIVRQSVLARGLDLSAGGLAQRDADFSTKLLQCCQNVAVALRRFVWPWPLSIDYDRHLIGEPGTRHVLLAFGLVTALAAVLWRRPALRERMGGPLLLALLFFLPTSGLLVALKSPTAERFLLLPCVGLALAGVAALPVAGVVATAAARRIQIALLGAILLALSTLTGVRTRQFRSEATLWTAELSIHPASIQARLGLLQVAHDAGDRDAEQRIAESILPLTAAGDARRITALFALGRSAFDGGRDDEGARSMEQARAEIVARGRVDDLDPTLHLVYVALANWQRPRLGPSGAEALLREGIGRFGRQPRLLEALGVTRDEQGDAAGADALYREALAGGEESATLRYHRALALVHLGRREEARRELEQALTLDPSHVPSHRLREELRH